MSRMIFCKKYGEELEGLDAPPYPGPKGQDVFDNVSKKSVAGLAGSPNYADQRKAPEFGGSFIHPGAKDSYGVDFIYRF